MRRDIATLAAFALSGLAVLLGIAVLWVVVWLVWPDEGTSSYSTAANVAQIALTAAGLTCAAFSARAFATGGNATKDVRYAILALLAWVVWWFVFVALSVGDSTAA